MVDFMNAVEATKVLASRVAEFGGRAYYVGGYVRDRLRLADQTDEEKFFLNNDSDIDIEVHGITRERVLSIINSISGALEYGRTFGVIGMAGYPIDVALPRSERACGGKHTDFDVTIDPLIGVEKAASRRDFTINAIMEDVLTGEIIDPFGGMGDLEHGIIRHVDSKRFSEDPLRVLRGAQFASRFGFEIAHDTVSLCRKISLGELSRERVEGEMKKSLTMSCKPSIFFECLRNMGQLSVWFSELDALIGVEQNPIYHAEGDVWNHTMLVLDRAANLREEAENPYCFMLSVLCHDFGKAVATEVRDGVIHSYGHAEKGVPIAKTFLSRLTGNKNVIRYVLNMVENHMKPNVMAYDNASVKSTNTLFDGAISPKDLILLALADNSGKKTGVDLIPADEFLYDRLHAFENTVSHPYVTGKDLINAGLCPGKFFGYILDYAHKLQLAGLGEDTVFRMTISYAEKIKINLP